MLAGGPNGHGLMQQKKGWLGRTSWGRQFVRGKSSGIASGSLCVDALVACIAIAVQETRASAHIGMKTAFRGKE